MPSLDWNGRFARPSALGRHIHTCLKLPTVIASFLHTLWLRARLRTEDDVTRWRQRCLDRFLSQDVGKVGFYFGTHGRLDALPVMDKAAVLANFEALNRGQVTLAEACQALDEGCDRVRGFLVGHSTGTTGNRGLFVVSERERFVWLGILLAKTLPDALWRRRRVAVLLPRFTRLYDAGAESGRIAMRFFDVSDGIEPHIETLRRFGPDAIVAPPPVLRRLAEAGGLEPEDVFSTAEVLDPLDRNVIAGAFRRPVREIYMATEGLLGVSCAHGVLHLAEDVMAFEWERPSPGSDLVSPLITDFTRRTQIMARYRMNDLILLRHAPCPCGSPLRAVERIEGRQDDVFHIPQPDGGASLMLTPDLLRNAVVGADRSISDFRLVQVGDQAIELFLDAAVAPKVASAAIKALQAAMDRAGGGPVEITLRRGIEPAYDRKLRRVRRAFSPAPRTGP